MSEPAETPPLFEMTPTPRRRSTGETAKRPPVVGWTTCPRCRVNERTAVIRDGVHLAYRGHTYTTWSGAAMTCPASWQRLCTLAPRPFHGDRAIDRCTCQGPVAELST